MIVPTPRPSRRGLFAATALGGGACMSSPALADPGGRTAPPAGAERGTGSLRPPPPALARERALAATEALLEHFRAETDPDMLIERVPRQQDDPEFTFVWPLSQARAAVTELVAAIEASRGPVEPADPDPAADPDLAAAAAALQRAQEHYWFPSGGTTGLPGYTAASDSAQGANGDFYYDDNDWIALLEIEQHLLTGGGAGDLARAGELLELFRSGESDDPDLPSPGGIFWTQGDGNETRNTVSTFPSAKVALRLHQITGEERALEDALRWMDWGRTTLRDPGTGLYWDNIDVDGTIDRTFWTYNQGVPLGCEALAFEITGDPSHRENALALAEAVIDHFSPFEAGSGFDEQPIQFNAILLSNLLMAESILGRRIQGRRITQASAQRLWEDRRDPETDLVTDSRETDEGTHLLDQAGFARTLALAAMPRSRWRHLS